MGLGKVKRDDASSRDIYFKQSCGHTSIIIAGLGWGGVDRIGGLRLEIKDEGGRQVLEKDWNWLWVCESVRDCVRV